MLCRLNAPLVQKRSCNYGQSKAKQSKHFVLTKRSFVVANTNLLTNRRFVLVLVRSFLMHLHCKTVGAFLVLQARPAPCGQKQARPALMDLYKSKICVCKYKSYTNPIQIGDLCLQQSCNSGGFDLYRPY